MPIALSGVRYWSDESTWTIIMTILFFPLLVKGSNVTLPIPYDESAGSMSSAFISTTTAAQETESIYLWIPLIIVIIFAMIITTLIVVGRQTQRAGCKCLGVPSSLESSTGSDETVVTNPRRNLTINVNLSCNSSDPIVPETPPPSYAVISRQISYISTISQTSSQIEIPPGYDEAIDIPEETPRRSKNRGSQQYSSRGSVTSQGQGGVANRIRLFSRSSSATDSPRRPALLRQQSTPVENRSTVLPAADTVPEHLVLEHPAVPITPTMLDIIHETTTGTEDIHLDSPIESNGVSTFYIGEAEPHNESTS